MTKSSTVLIFGTNDNATACALKLYRAGFSVTLVSNKTSLDMHFFRNFSSVLANGSKEINGVKAQSYADFLYHQNVIEKPSLQNFINYNRKDNKISVLTKEDVFNIKIEQFNYIVICDSSICASINNNNIITISCQQNFDADYNIIQTGPNTGQVKYAFLEFESEEEDKLNIHYSELEGLFIAEKNPGEKCFKGEKLATIHSTPLISKFDGQIEGIVQSGIIVKKLDPLIYVGCNKNFRANILPLESFLIAGGVLESIMFHIALNNLNII